MAADESNLLEWGFKGLVTVAFTVGGWLWTMLVKDVRSVEKEVNDHKVNVAGNFVTKGELSMIRMETNESLQRIHQRIDEGNRSTEGSFKDVRSDIGEIKNLLIERSK